MKILFLIRSLEAGGAERQLVLLANGLKKRGHQVDVAVFYPGGCFEKDLKDVPLHSLGKTGRWDIAGFIQRLHQLVRELRPDVLHGYMGTANVLSALLKPAQNNMSVVWGVRASNMDLAEYDWLSRVFYYLESILGITANLIIANSGAAIQANENRLGFAKKIVLSHNGIDTDSFSRDEDSGRLIREKWGIDANEVLVGMVGRIDPMKDHSTFLQAAARASVEMPQLKFVCVGGGSAKLLHELKLESDTLGLGEKVLWAGHVGDMNAVYSSLDLLSLSSAFGEGFPNVVGEAMACGVPCVVTDVGDAARVVGDCGAVVPPKSPDLLGEAMVAIARRLAAENTVLRSQVRKRVEDCFSVDQLVSRTEEYLTRLRVSS